MFQGTNVPNSKLLCLQIIVILTGSLLPMKQGFYKAMCTCIAMGVLNAKLIVLKRQKEGRGLLPWQQGLQAKSHTMHYYCPKRCM